MIVTTMEHWKTLLPVLLWIAGVAQGLDIPDTSAIYNLDSWVPVKNVRLEPLPLPPVSTSWQDPNAEIFVGVSHYRDSRCTDTLNNIFKKAKFPDRIKVGIVQQIHTEKDDFDCIKDYCAQFTSRGEQCGHRQQIKVIEFTHHDSRGTAYARYQQNSMMEDEEFCMQVDSHSDFISNWDTALTRMWGSIENEYAIISTAPVDLSTLRDNANSEVLPHLCQATFDARGMLINLPPTAAAHLSKPILSPLYNAGFSFAKCHFERKVPNDPNLQMIFDADEFTKYARLWTRGYDVYTPNQIVVGHDYEGVLQRRSENKDPLEWVRNGMTPEFARSLYDHSVARIATLLGFPEGNKDVVSVSLLTKYGLGSKRTLDQLIEFTGIDLRKKVIYGDRCLELSWVPFTADRDPWTTDGDVWGMAPEMLIKGGPNIPLLKSGSVDVYSEKMFSESPAELNARKARALSELSGQTKGEGSGAETEVETKHLRASGGAKGIEELGEEVVLEIENEFRHRGKELWWIFQSVDTAVETLMNHIDEEIGMGHGHRVVKLILLLAPVFAFVVGGAIWMMTAGSKSMIFDSNLKKI